MDLKIFLKAKGPVRTLPKRYFSSETSLIVCCLKLQKKVTKTISIQQSNEYKGRGKINKDNKSYLVLKKSHVVTFHKNNIEIFLSQKKYAVTNSRERYPNTSWLEHIRRHDSRYYSHKGTIIVLNNMCNERPFFLTLLVRIIGHLFNHIILESFFRFHQLYEFVV